MDVQGLRHEEGNAGESHVGGEERNPEEEFREECSWEVVSLSREET